MKLKVFTAFSGYDSQCLALDRLHRDFPDFEYELVGWSEIDKYAILAHNAIYPDASDRNFGDISKVDWEGQVPDFDLFTYSFPCFIAGTLIYTTLGYKPIEEIQCGDLVLTHTKSFKPVTQVMKKSSQGVRFAIKAMCSDTIHCTEEHPFYARRMYRYGHKRTRTFASPEWIKASELTKEYYVGYPINQVQEMPQWEGTTLHNWGHDIPRNSLSQKFTNPDFWYLMGRYVGDGWQRNAEHGKGIVICCGGRNLAKLLNAFKSVGWNVVWTKEKTVTKYHVCSKELHEFVQRYGHKAHGKTVDVETLNLPTSLLKAFLDGVIDSDGCRIGKYYKITSVSKKLIFSIGQCVAKIYRRPFSISRTKRPNKYIIEGREVNQRDSYSLSFKTEDNKQDHAFYEDGYLWFPINGIQKYIDSYEVYNLSVSEDESYTANGIAVHNCQDISNAGLQRGFSEGSGTRSGLLWECRRAIEAKKPRFLLMENVKALVQKKFMPEFNRWQQWLEEQGYKNFWQVLNAKHFGVPQNRERVFMVSILTEGRETATYEFPKSFPLDRCIADILEDDVDESYYLRQEQVDKIIAHCDRKQLEGCGFSTNFQSPDGISGAIKTREGSREYDTYLKQQETQNTLPHMTD